MDIVQPTPGAFPVMRFPAPSNVDMGNPRVVKGMLLACLLYDMQACFAARSEVGKSDTFRAVWRIMQTRSDVMGMWRMWFVREMRQTVFVHSRRHDLFAYAEALSAHALSLKEGHPQWLPRYGYERVWFADRVEGALFTASGVDEGVARSLVTALLVWRLEHVAPNFPSVYVSPYNDQREWTDWRFPL